MWTPPERIKHAIAPTRWPTAEEAAASRWFSPLELPSGLRLNTRTWVPAMVPWRATEDGLVTDDVVDWYARFAEGRPGAIVVEATGIRDIPSGPLLRIGDDRFLAGLERLVSAVRRASGGETRLFIQLIDFLAVKRRPDPRKFFARFLQVDRSHRARLAAALDDPRWVDPARATDDDVRARLAQPHADDERQAALVEAVLTARELRDLRYGYREEVNDVHLPHIASLPATLPELFARAASRALTAGFDGVELHYAHAYTMASFLSGTNRRADGYGGSLEGRQRLPREVARATREAVGHECVVGCRLLGDEVIPGGTTPAEAVEHARALASEGLDFISVSKGGKFDDAKQPAVGAAVYPYTGPSGYECMPTVYSDERGPFGRNVPLAAAVRQAVRADDRATPVVAAGGINSFEQAEGILARGQADVVAAARQSLADPDWFLKIRQGRGDAIRRCKFTNYCEALDQKHKQVTCQLWDRVDLDGPDVPLSADGRRRLIAPRDR